MAGEGSQHNYHVVAGAQDTAPSTPSRGSCYLIASPRQPVSLGESLTKALREAGISYPTFQRLHRPLGEASVLIPSSVANIGLVRAFKVIKGASAELQKVSECQQKEATDAGLII